jgi:hypothetical protein
MIKGGIWKNTEDEILKAAVMKYGKNQWAGAYTRSLQSSTSGPSGHIHHVADQLEPLRNPSTG